MVSQGLQIERMKPYPHEMAVSVLQCLGSGPLILGCFKGIGREIIGDILFSGKSLASRFSIECLKSLNSSGIDGISRVFSRLKLLCLT